MSTIERCNICGNVGKMVYNLGEYNVMYCSQCDLKWVDVVYDEMEYVKFDYYWNYDFFITQEKYFRKIARHDLKYVLKIFYQLNINNYKWVDFGCGFGYLISEAQKLGFTVTGVEAKKEVVEYVKKREKINIINSLIDDVELPFNTYGIVSFFDVLEHLSDPKSAIIKAKDVLQNNGLLVIEVPDDKSLFREIAVVIYKFSRGKWKGLLESAFQKHPGGHRYGFTKKSLKKLLNQNKFQIVKIKKVMTPYKVFIWDTIRKKSLIMKTIYFLVSSGIYFLSIFLCLQNRIKIYAKKV